MGDIQNYNNCGTYECRIVLNVRTSILEHLCCMIFFVNNEGGRGY